MKRFLFAGLILIFPNVSMKKLYFVYKKYYPRMDAEADGLYGGEIESGNEAPTSYNFQKV